MSPSHQARYLTWALTAARADAHVRMFVWFVLRDRKDMPWKGGLERENGAPKAGFGRFSRAARGVDARDPVETVRTEQPYPRVSIPVRRFGWFDAPGSTVTAAYSVTRAGRAIAAGAAGSLLRPDGTIVLRPLFWPVAGPRYVLTVRAEDQYGNVVRSRLELVPLGHGTAPPWAPGGICPAVDTLLRNC